MRLPALLLLSALCPPSTSLRSCGPARRRRAAPRAATDELYAPAGAAPAGAASTVAAGRAASRGGTFSPLASCTSRKFKPGLSSSIIWIAVVLVYLW